MSEPEKPRLRPGQLQGVTQPGRRAYGFQSPLHPRQLAAMFGFLWCLGVFSAIQAPVLPLWTLFLYYSSFIIGMGAFLVVSLTDPGLNRNDTRYSEKVESTSPGREVHEGVMYCNTCQAYMPVRTKHCRLCHKCVEGFDHHCLYLNTCIASANYAPFFILAFLGTFVSGFQLALSCWMFTQHNDAQFVRDVVSFSAFSNADVYLGLLAFLNILVLGVFGGVGSLFAFHTYICVRGITTYEWILELRQKAVERENERLKKAAQSPAVLQKQEEARQAWQAERAREKERRARIQAREDAKRMADMEKSRQKSHQDVQMVRIDVESSEKAVLPHHEHERIHSQEHFSEHERDELVKKVSDLMGVGDLEEIMKEGEHAADSQQ